MSNKLCKPIALITGASRGIGKAIAEELACRGYDLILTCSNTIAELEKVADKLEKEYEISCRAIQVDGANYEQVEALFQEIEQLDVLINNAGISYVGLLMDMTPEAWHRVIGVNLDSAFYMSKFAVPLMLKNEAYDDQSRLDNNQNNIGSLGKAYTSKGHIINISSVWGNVGASMEVAYSASKGGINSFTKALAKELAPSNIAVNAIACGVIDTSMNACFSKEDMDNLKKEIPADRIGQPQEVAQLVVNIINSPSYMTGQVITIDGGWT